MADAETNNGSIAEALLAQALPSNQTAVQKDTGQKDPFLDYARLEADYQRRIDSLKSSFEAELRQELGKKDQEFAVVKTSYEERLQLANSRISDLEARVNSAVPDQLRVPINTPEGFYRAIADIAEKKSQARGTHSNALFKMLKAHGLNDQTAIDISLKALQYIFVAEEIYDRLKCAADEIDQRLKLLAQREENADRLITQADEVDKKLSTAKNLEEALESKANELTTKEKDLAELAMQRKQIEEYTQEMKLNIAGLRSYHNLMTGYAEGLRAIILQQYQGFTGRIINIKNEYGVEGAAILPSKTYSDKLNPIIKVTDIIIGLNPEKTAKLTALVAKCSPSNQELTGTDKALGKYFITTIYSENTSIATFCVTGIPTEYAQIGTQITDQLRLVANSLTNTILTHYASLHFLSEQGQFGYLTSRLERLERELNNGKKPA